MNGLKFLTYNISDIKIPGIYLDFISSNITGYKTNAIYSCHYMVFEN